MPGFTVGDLFRLRWFGRPQVSPDGELVACVETTLDQSADMQRRRAVVLPSSGGAAWPAAQCDAGSLAWSPDSLWLAVGGQDGLWAAFVNGAEPRKLASGDVRDVDCSLGAVAFARDDELLVASTDDARSLAVARGAAPRAPRWSPDGAWLAYLSDDGLFVWNSDADVAPRRLPVPPARVSSFAWSPDGLQFAILGRTHAELVDVGLRLWVVDAESGSGRELRLPGAAGLADAALGSALRGDDPRGAADAALCWSPATGRIYVETAWHGRGPLAWFDADGSNAGQLLDGEHACMEPSVVPGGRLVVVICGPSGPGDIWLVDERNGARARLTAADDSVRDLAAPVEHLEVLNGDGVIDAWLTGSPDTRPAPLIVSVHGGPHYGVGWRFTFETQRLAALGAFVLTLNPRGSSGRGDAFASGNRGDWGGADAADITAATDAVLARPELDATRVAVTGVSYGGFMSQWLIASSPRYCSAISENGISDFESMWTACPDDRPSLELALGGTPSSSGLFEQRSPLRHADRISAPLLLVHAVDDKNVPLAQSVAMHEALRARAADVELLQLPDEGHLINLVGRPSSRLARAAAVDSFLARTLFDSHKRSGTPWQASGD